MTIFDDAQELVDLAGDTSPGPWRIEEVEHDGLISYDIRDRNNIAIGQFEYSGDAALATAGLRLALNHIATRRPAFVTTETERALVPCGAIVRTPAGVILERHDADTARCFGVATTWGWRAAALPLTVLHWPTDTGVDETPDEVELL